MPVIEARISDLDRLAVVLLPSRTTDPIANDAFEAAQDWAELGRALLDSDRADLRHRGRQEQDLLADLEALLDRTPLDAPRRSDLAAVIDAGRPVIDAALARPADPDGHLGFARVAREAFAVLIARGFALTQNTPRELDLRSTSAWVRLRADDDLEATVAFGPPGSRLPYSIADLLFAQGGDFWREATGRAPLTTEAELHAWFTRAASWFLEHGRDVIDGRPDAFERLERAAAARDAAFNREMGARHAATPGHEA